MQSAPIWVAGEALIDLLPGTDSFIPVVGGGPANTAKALANLGIETSFIGGISTDQFGLQVEKELASYGVNLNKAERSSWPTALAVVTLDETGAASYEFRLEGTATFNFGSWLPKGKPNLLHIGTLATIIEPGATALFEWAKGLDTQIVFDPNVRTAVIRDRDVYRSNFKRWAEISSIVKLSDEDFAWLEFSVDEILDFGVELVVVTHGKDGLSGFRIDQVIKVPGVEVAVVDTVGAGDTVGAVIIEGILKYGELSGENLEKVLRRAARAAAITCTREGAKPPSLMELES